MKRLIRSIGYAIGSFIGLSALIYLSLPVGESQLMPGALNIGHQDLDCKSCHLPAEGSFRQQIQANFQYLLGTRTRLADFGRKLVSNEHCLHCHDRPNDRHPVYRFFEPRYEKARQQIQPQFCSSCHKEHSGKRVTKNDLGFCKVCHNKLILKQDPISVPHKDLIAEKRWNTCLGCHDFHGNHIMETARQLEKRHKPEQIRHYFLGESTSPYAAKKYHQAKQERQNES